MDIIVVYCTVPTKKIAKDITKVLMKHKLAACGSMIENVKYKAADLAKDLKEPVKDILDVLGEKFPAKKAQTALTEEELKLLK